MHRLLFISVLLAGVVGCDDKKASPPKVAAAPGVGEARNAAKEGDAAPDALPQSERKIVYTARVELHVANLDDARGQLDALLAEVKGYVAKSDESGRARRDPRWDVEAASAGRKIPRLPHSREDLWRVGESIVRRPGRHRGVCRYRSPPEESQVRGGGPEQTAPGKGAEHGRPPGLSTANLGCAGTDRALPGPAGHSVPADGPDDDRSGHARGQNVRARVEAFVWYDRGPDVFGFSRRAGTIG